MRSSAASRKGREADGNRIESKGVPAGDGCERFGRRRRGDAGGVRFGGGRPEGGCQGGACGSRGPDGRSFVVFDSNWDEYLQTFGQKACREPIQEGVARQPLVPEYYQDYHAGVQDAIDAGIIKECGTLAELAEELGLDADVLVRTVEDWNAMVATGHDDEVFPYEDGWLHPVDTPPYYGAKISGNLFMTQTGLLVNTRLQVLDTEGRAIPGLYAGWHTAGGAAAPDAVTSMAFDTGGVSKSYLGGYLAAESIAELE